MDGWVLGESLPWSESAANLTHNQYVSDQMGVPRCVEPDAWQVSLTIVGREELSSARA
jgi:hypothetical protein